jgi:hypothetical protein
MLNLGRDTWDHPLEDLVTTIAHPIWKENLFLQDLEPGQASAPKRNPPSTPTAQA